MHIIRTSAELTKTQTLSPVEGEGVAEISIMFFIKHYSCHKIITSGNSLAFEGFVDSLVFNHEMPA
jgi:hypothetical protein